MSNQTKTIANNQLDKVPLDLRASAFVRVKKGSWWLRLITLALVDSTLLSLVWILAQHHASSVDVLWNTPSSYIPMLVMIQIAALALQGIYQSGKSRCDYFGIIKTLSFAHGLILIVCFLYQPILDVPRSTFILSWLMSISFICSGRLIINFNLEYFRKQKLLGRNSVFIICEPEDTEHLVNLIKKEKRYIVRGTANARSLDRYCRQKTLDTLKKLDITEVFIAWDAIQNRMFLYWLFQTSGISVHILPMELKPIHRRVGLQKIGGMTCLSFDSPIITGNDFWIKRVFDFCFTALFLIFSFPIYIAIALAIKLDSPGAIFYKQTRIGLHGKPFKVWKFRTMVSNADKLQKKLEALNETKDGIIFKIKDDPRITRVGKFLRRYSLDELPQLFNVLLGEMSLVGPRPLPTRDVDKFSERHFIRQEVLPGVTGLWQVSGRSNIMDFEQVINLDLHYIENWSLKLDFKILLRTIMVVLKKEGAY
ncbi:sugar transferase [Halotia branconii]|uniref:Sugar transferase n=1 Tax=Halotia branconii CENA392 TaxID=1539056 RepID=A0AAJ6NWI3_9CYAN|nr:sugar transferase [Halotia branconii]WGV27788.1 sugar transferase [Halotia branconii CENA392]